MKAKTIDKILLGIAIFSLILIEIFAAKLALETIGEITSGLYYLAIAINIIPILMLLFSKQKQVATIIILLIGFIIIPYQLYLGDKLLSLKEESANITAYLYEGKIQDNIYPNDLSGYAFSSPELEKHFNYNRESDAKFNLSYFVGTKNTSHYYNPEAKKWAYYPD